MPSAVDRRLVEAICQTYLLSSCCDPTTEDGKASCKFGGGRLTKLLLLRGGWRPRRLISANRRSSLEEESESVITILLDIRAEESCYIRVPMLSWMSCGGHERRVMLMRKIATLQKDEKVRMATVTAQT